MDPSGNTSSNQPLIFRGRLLVFTGGSTGIFPKNDPKFAEDPQVESIKYDHGIMLVYRPVPKITATIGRQLDPPGNAVEGGSVWPFSVQLVDFSTDAQVSEAEWKMVV